MDGREADQPPPSIECNVGTPATAELLTKDTLYLALSRISWPTIYICLRMPHLSQVTSVPVADLIVAMQHNLTTADVGAGMVAAPCTRTSVQRCCR